MIDYNAPIRIFYANLLRFGFRLSVAEGQLQVRGPMQTLSPAYRDEIVRRRQHLIDLLSPEPPEPLAPYAYRLLTLAECNQALEIAKQMAYPIQSYPVDGGWLLEFLDTKEVTHA